MAMRQQHQIDTQHQMLAAKEQRLRFLKSQETRNAVSVAEAERLRRLRERVEAQESKLRRLRALRGQVDLQKTYNVTLGNDLDSIRALFSEKEKELTLAVAKVEALTRQLEELRRDRRGVGNGTNGISYSLNSNPHNNNATPAAKELEKLRLELAYRNQLSMQQNARLNMQRETLQQRQIELHSVDKRIVELQSRINKKRILNVQNYNLNAGNVSPGSGQNNHGKIAPSSVNQPLHSRTLRAAGSDRIDKIVDNSRFRSDRKERWEQQVQFEPAWVKNKDRGPDACMLERIAPGRSSSTHIISSHSRTLSRGNIVAVEPFNHIPAKSSSLGDGSNFTSPASSLLSMNDKPQPSISNSSDYIQPQHVQQLQLQNYQWEHETSMKTISGEEAMLFAPESDEKKLAVRQQQQHQQQQYRSCFAENLGNVSGTGTENGTITGKEVHQNMISDDFETKNNSNSQSNCDNSNDYESDLVVSLDKGQSKHSNIEIASATGNSQDKLKHNNLSQPKASHIFLQNIPLGNLVVSPRKPINSVAPTLAMKPSSSTVASSYNLCGTTGVKITRVTRKVPTCIESNVMTLSEADPTTISTSPNNNNRPALPPKPNKISGVSNAGTNPLVVSGNNNEIDEYGNEMNVAFIEGLTNNEIDAPASASFDIPDLSLQGAINKQSTVNDKLPIKAKPLTIRKHPFLEQPKLKNFTNSVNLNCNANTALNKFPISSATQQIINKRKETATANTSEVNETTQYSNCESESLHSTKYVSDNSEFHADVQGNAADIGTDNGNGITLGEGSKHKLSRRVSFDPLALLLDASLEGELELVEKTAMQVTNPSAANDEGITALHNAICAGHFEIVKFLVNFGCDVNAQDSDGWTPLHCAASCNNLPMVKFLVESGACLFAATLSDHETPAEKCEEDEEGFDGCSEYLYSIQEKLGILNNGEVYAVFSYESQQPDELSFFVNDTLTIIRKGDEAEREWWWARSSLGSEGYVPRNLLGLHPRLTPSYNDEN
ncbi:AGAP012439-PA [Anopheles gambiae str. PEST]|uniref:AGAP012439-PA n=1 Tax=Anopheles gambiae TaxID=7165 RepID=Q7PNK8_ANOGA|nr:AGAP012439-PA [Anopheles gambiae str. PEST]